MDDSDIRACACTMRFPDENDLTDVTFPGITGDGLRLAGSAVHGEGISEYVILIVYDKYSPKYSNWAPFFFGISILITSDMYDGRKARNGNPFGVRHQLANVEHMTSGLSTSDHCVAGF
jgi:hypothetical protein